MLMQIRALMLRKKILLWKVWKELNSLEMMFKGKMIRLRIRMIVKVLRDLSEEYVHHLNLIYNVN